MSTLGPLRCSVSLDSSAFATFICWTFASFVGLTLVLASSAAVSAQSFAPNFVFNSDFDDDLAVGGWLSPPEADLTPLAPGRRKT